MALAAQGFAARRPAAGARVDGRRVRTAVACAGVFQIDSVNVLVRSHELPVFSRVGAYPRPLSAVRVGSHGGLAPALAVA